VGYRALRCVGVAFTCYVLVAAIVIPNPGAPEGGLKEWVEAIKPREVRAPRSENLCHTCLLEERDIDNASKTRNVHPSPSPKGVQGDVRNPQGK